MTEQSAEQAQLGPSLDGTVVLDIGGDVGALVLTTGPDLHLAEIEISRLDGGHPLATGPEQHTHRHTHDGDEHAHGHSHDDGHGHPHDGAPRTHVAVRERLGVNGAVRYAAIYPNLLAGDYTVWGTDGSAAAQVTIVGGEVAQLDWT